MKTNETFAKTIILVFGLLGIVCLIGSFWNISQLFFAFICGIMVALGVKDLKDK
jgi:hypothetical protein